MDREIRRKDRSVTDKTQIEQIIAAAKILHIGLMDGDFPYVVPLHYGYEYIEEENSYVFYMHGARNGHKIDAIRANGNVCIELETDVELESGGDIACRYGSFYSSVIGRGTASLISDVQEKKHGLELLMKNQTGRYFELSEQMISSVEVIRVKLHSLTAKAKRKMA